MLSTDYEKTIQIVVILQYQNSIITGRTETQIDDVYSNAKLWCLEQCCRFSRNIAEVTPEIIYFYYQQIYLQDESIHKNSDLILEKKLHWS